MVVFNIHMDLKHKKAYPENPDKLFVELSNLLCNLTRVRVFSLSL